MAGVKQELWTGMLISQFRFMGSWAEGLNDESSYVGNDAIHLVELGADPDVLINNTVYPIAVNDQIDQDIVVALTKFDTTNTRIKDDELYALPYDKPGSSMRKHRLRIEQTARRYGLYSIAPASNLAKTPVLKTTGDNDETGTRKRMRIEDIIRLKKHYDDAEIPLENRELVLCNDHIQDLLMVSQDFKEKYTNIQSGQVLDLYGFKTSQDVYAPMYDPTTLTKKAFNAVATTEKNASTAFYKPDVFRASGSIKMYYELADTTPTTRQSVMGFRMYHIILPYTRRSQAAIVSDVNA